MKKYLQSQFKNIAKSIIRIMLIGSVLISPSCKKWLNEKPQSQFAASTFFANENEAYMATMGVYEVMSSTQTYGFNISMVFDIDTDIAQMSGADFSNDPRVIAHYGVTPVHGYLLQAWSMLYKGIDRANLVIQQVPIMSQFTNGTATEKTDLKRMLAEAKFLRGFYYAELSRLFGDVPMKLKPTQASDDLQLPRTDRMVVYTQVIKDMTEAIDDIPWASQKTSDERLSKGAVKGILARVALFAGGYSLRQNGQMERPANYKDYYNIALQQTKDIMASGEHILNVSYEQIFRNQCKLVLEPKENMFEVAFYNSSGASANSSWIGTWNAPVADAGNPYGRANSFYKTTALFQKSYQAGDLRRDVAVCTYKIDAKGNQVPLTTGRQDETWSPGKWRRDWQGSSPKDLNNTDINWCVLRYADILLMRAEAENEINEGPSPDAYNAINMVRRRAYGKPLTSADATADLSAGLNKSTFLDRIKQERAWELCFEGMRKADLIRWNILGPSLRLAQAALKAYRSNYAYVAGTNFMDNKHELFPIPAAEFDVDHNQGFKQNPNY